MTCLLILVNLFFLNSIGFLELKYKQNNDSEFGLLDAFDAQQIRKEEMNFK